MNVEHINPVVETLIDGNVDPGSEKLHEEEGWRAQRRGVPWRLRRLGGRTLGERRNKHPNRAELGAGRPTQRHLTGYHTYVSATR